ncbi:hypothetical protein DV515_00012878 [Chloebia gouldiae]|uniref:Uncharacterized protein n=1 Tax=Chloebia gouldiae TaxID=44316 RepID=A0A3L8S2H0_CHLGU|nr:hypothetical protein DV515_00012878 [Chloebia gouldiae]
MASIGNFLRRSLRRGGRRDTERITRVFWLLYLKAEQSRLEQSMGWGGLVRSPPCLFCGGSSSA